MKYLKIILSIFCLCVYTISSSYGQLQLEENIAAENYLGWDNALSNLNEIVGLHELDDRTILWVNQSGFATFFDTKDRLVLNSTKINETIISKSIYHAATNQLIVCEGGYKLLVFDVHKNDLVQQETIADDKDNKEITYNDFALNAQGNQLASFVEDSILVFYDKIEGAWAESRMPLNNTPFTIAYANDASLYLGMNDGSVQILDIATKKIKKNKKILDSTIAQFAFSADRKEVAITDQDIVKLCPLNLSSSRSIKSNLELIGNIAWVAPNRLLCAGYDNGIELWDTSDKNEKVLLAHNLAAHQFKKHKEIKPLKAWNDAYVLLSDGIENLYMKKLYANVSAIDLTEKGFLAIVQRNFDLQSLQIRGDKIYFKEKINVFEHIIHDVKNQISDLQIKDESIIYIGGLYSGGGVNLKTNKVEGFMANSHWRSYSQIDFTAFNDVLVYKTDNGFEERREGAIMLEYNIGRRSKKRSKLNKALQKAIVANVKMKELLNPSGFKIAPDKRNLITYDATGQVELFSFESLEVEFSGILSDAPIIDVFFTGDNRFFLVDQAGKLAYYNIDKKDKDHQVKLKEAFTIADSISKIAYNQADLLAVYDSSAVKIYNLKDRKYQSTLHNQYEGFNIDLVNFIPLQSNFVYALNKKIEKATLIEEMPNTGAVQLIEQVHLQENNLILGNSNGEILFYKLEEDTKVK